MRAFVLAQEDLDEIEGQHAPLVHNDPNDNAEVEPVPEEHKCAVPDEWTTRDPHGHDELEDVDAQQPILHDPSVMGARDVASQAHEEAVEANEIEHTAPETPGPVHRRCP